MTRNGRPDTGERPPVRSISPGTPALGSELLVFRAGPEYFAVPIAGIEAVIELPAVQPLPGMPVGMLGVSELRGNLVPVYSPARVLNVELDAAAAAIIIRVEHRTPGAVGRQVAIAVSTAEGVLPYEPSSWSGVGGPTPRAGLVRGVASVDGRLTTLVDMVMLLEACVESATVAAP